VPDLEGEGIGAVVEGMERGNHAAPNPDEVSVKEVSRKLAGQLATARKKQEHPKRSF
jgi:hypothetical protein